MTLINVQEKHVGVGTLENRQRMMQIQHLLKKEKKENWVGTVSACRDHVSRNVSLARGVFLPDLAPGGVAILP